VNVLGTKPALKLAGFAKPKVVCLVCVVFAAVLVVFLRHRGGGRKINSARAVVGK
jgi:hypothetical protein